MHMTKQGDVGGGMRPTRHDKGGVMSGRKLKKKKKRKPDRMICPNCGEKGPHFAPPSLGETGFFICTKPPATIRRSDERARGSTVVS